MNSQLAQLLKNKTEDQIQPALVEVALKPLADAGQVWEAVHTFPFDSGWICLTDQVVPLYSSHDLAAVPNGIILSAELAGATQSLHIRQSENGWVATTITVGSGEPCLMLTEQYLSTVQKQQLSLGYQLFWKETEGGYAPFVARFTGWEKGEKQR